MTTIKISVRNKRDAGLLIRMLKRIPFIDNVQEIRTNQDADLQFNKLRELFLSSRNSDFLSQISDPVQWQKDLRNEWQ